MWVNMFTPHFDPSRTTCHDRLSSGRSGIATRRAAGIRRHLDPNTVGVRTGWVREVAAYFELHTRVSTGLYGGVLDRGWTERSYRTRLYPDPPAALGGLATGGGAVKLENMVPAVKSWFYQQSERSLLVLDSVDSIDDADDSSYVNLEYFVPDA
jgi:hypothetical protein